MQTELGTLRALHETLVKYCLDDEQFAVVIAYLAREYPLDVRIFQAQGWGLGDYEQTPELHPQGPTVRQKDHVYYNELALVVDGRCITLIGGVEEEAALHSRLLETMRRYLREDNMGCQYARTHFKATELPVIDDLSVDTQQASKEIASLITMHVQAILLEGGTRLARNANVTMRL